MGMEDINLIKAFIKDGEIYINSDLARIEDAFHEYAHLFLGALKANPDFRDNYLAFVDKVLSTKKGQDAFNRKKKKFSNLKVNLFRILMVPCSLYGSVLILM